MQHEDELIATAAQMVAQGKGLLAADESGSTANKRLASVHVPQDEEHRRQYRELFLAADGIENYISGVILYDETLHQLSGGISFVQLLQKKGIIPGIKVDTGAKDLALFPGEKITEGLDGLRERLADYYKLGCRFTKWRAVITIDEKNGLPTEQCIAANVHALARYAALSQEQGLVPVVEPEVLLDGNHSSAKAETVTTLVLKTLFDELKRFNVFMPGVLLKTSMVVPGKDSGEPMVAVNVAEMTARTLRATVPTDLGGVVFLSGGQSARQATENLQEISKLGSYPWAVSFSYARALQGPSLTIWAGDPAKVPAARDMFIKRCMLTSSAREGKYDPAEENL